jgi:carbohydrate binding protein with CBM6 domain
MRIRWTCVCALMMSTVMCGAMNASAALTPYSGAPVALPGTIQAANFDNGGEGVAYHDTSIGNAGGAYRSTDADIEPASEGGYDVGWIDAGEWVNYTVSVAVAGNYAVTLRVASLGSGGSLHIGFNGPSSVWKTVAIPITGGWQNWTNVVVPVTLGAGVQQITLLFDTPGFNISSIAVASASAGGLTPYSGTPVALPGVVLAANFDNGGEGVAYHDTTSGNTGGTYRSTDVDIEPASDGGRDIGWIAAGEWLNYTVNVPTAGAYVAQLRVASPAGASMHIGFNTASNVWIPLCVPPTGGWQAWTTVSVPVTLGAGMQQLTLLFDTAGLNIESIAVSAASQSASPPQSTGSTVRVAAGGNLQAAIDNAQLGDTIVLQAGATYTGNFVLPAKALGSGYVTITTSADPAALPPEEGRIDPSYAGLLPKIQSPNSAPAIATAPFAHHYQLQLLEFPATAQGIGDIITLGDGSSNQNTLAAVPHDLVLDRVYVHGDATFGQKRGIALNSASTTIKNSYIAGIASAGQDAQAICGWNGPGPFAITNNYLEASTENLMFGGADPHIPNLVPSDITITRNLVSKPLAWRGQAWQVKNLLEFKNAQRVIVDGNVLENNWQAAQVGYAILFTPRNQDHTAPWSVVQQIQFTNNIVRHVAAAVNILGTDDLAPSQKTNAITIRNNLFEDVSGARYGGNGWFMLINGTPDVTVDHNTIVADGTSDVFADGAPSTGFVFTNNVMQNNSWAIMGNSASPGNGTIAAFFPRSQFAANVIDAASATTYPAGNFFPANLSEVGFVNLGNGNYRLSSSSPYTRSATDGTDVGANIDAINSAAATRY